MGFELKVFGRELVSVKSGPTTMQMGNSSGLGSDIVDLNEIFPASFRGFGELNGSTFYPKYSTVNDFTRAFLECPVIGTVIARKSSAFSEGIINAKSIQTQEEVKGKDLRWQNIIRKPNPFQTEDQFKTQINTYCSIYGYALALKDPVGVGTPWDIKSIWALPMQYLDVKFKTGGILTMDRIDLIESISMTIGGVTEQIDKENVYMFTYKGPTISDKVNVSNPLIPQSPLVGIEKPIENVIIAYEASGSMQKYRGALGAFVNRGMDAAGAVPLDDEDKEDLQSDWRRHGIRDHQRKVIITNAHVDWVQIGMKVKDLMLHEEIRESSSAICDRFGYPTHLMSFGKGTTFNNMEIADKRTYTNAIVPEGVHFTEQLNEFLDTASNGFYYEIDFSHVEALQEDKKEAAEARKKRNDALKIEYEANQITKNEWRRMNGDEEVSGWDIYKYEFDAMINVNNTEE